MDDETRPEAAPHDAMPVDPKLLESVVCPATLGPLEYDRAGQRLLSRKAKLAYPIRDGVPILLTSAAEPIED